MLLYLVDQGKKDSSGKEDIYTNVCENMSLCVCKEFFMFLISVCSVKEGNKQTNEMYKHSTTAHQLR